jgi:hypothetical protein
MKISAWIAFGIMYVSLWVGVGIALSGEPIRTIGGAYSTWLPFEMALVVGIPLVIGYIGGKEEVNP